MSGNKTYANSIWNKAETMGFGDVHFKLDTSTGLRAIIAIHDTRLGPALGGCRLVSYPSMEFALLDALRLAQGMSYKAAISGLKFGGGKSVILRPREIQDREALFESFGEFVDQMSGRYITAVDSGTQVSDMDIIARRTHHVVSTSNSKGGTGDPSPYTAYGVLRGIQAAVAYQLDRVDLSNIHVAIQGAGHVGYHLAKALYAQGAELTVCDIDDQAAERIVRDFNATKTSPDFIYDVSCDVFSPCALGGTINAETVSRLRASIIAGAANNQLLNKADAQKLLDKHILHVPDYVINAGGLIQIGSRSDAETYERLDRIYDTLMLIFRRAEEENCSATEVADRRARELLAAGRC